MPAKSTYRIDFTDLLADCAICFCRAFWLSNLFIFKDVCQTGLSIRQLLIACYRNDGKYSFTKGLSLTGMHRVKKLLRTVQWSSSVTALDKTVDDLSWTKLDGAFSIFSAFIRFIPLIVQVQISQYELNIVFHNIIMSVRVLMNKDRQQDARAVDRSLDSDDGDIEYDKNALFPRRKCSSANMKAEVFSLNNR